MEFPFNINDILPGEISVIDSNLKVSDISSEKLKVHTTKPAHENDRSPGHSKHISSQKDNRDKVKCLIQIIDALGEASAKAQNLHKPITTGNRLQKSDQRIYIMKDSESNSGLGIVLGMLKVGKKRLFVLDERGAHNEMDPLCVLDFYVHESIQRQGYGHLLFEKMLKVEEVLPHHLAIDRPSEKFLAFLRKYYGLKSTILQANNFVVFSGFFDGQKITRPAIFLYCKRGERKSDQRKKKSKGKTNSEEINALKEVEVPLNMDKTRGRSKSTSTGAGRCLQWNDELYYKEKSHFSHTSQSSSPVLIRNSTKATSNNAKFDRMKVASSDGELDLNTLKKEDTKENNKTTISLGATSASWGPDLSGTSPVSNIRISQNPASKWHHWQSSSWKILGIPPPDYSRVSSPVNVTLITKKIPSVIASGNITGDCLPHN